MWRVLLPTGSGGNPRNGGGEEELLLAKGRSIQKMFLPFQSSPFFIQVSLSGLILSFGRTSCPQVYQYLPRVDSTEIFVISGVA